MARLGISCIQSLGRKGATFQNYRDSNGNRRVKDDIAELKQSD